MHSTMPPSEAVFRSLRNAAAVLNNHGLSHAEVDATMCEAFALFYTGRALETADPRAQIDRLIEACVRHLDNQGLSAAVRNPVRRVGRRFFGLFARRAA